MSQCFNRLGRYFVDGYNRHEICSKYNILFNIIQKDFKDIDEAKQWIYKNQLGRRNLTDKQRDIIVGRLYKEEKKDPADNLKQNISIGHNVPSMNTAKIIAEQYSVNEKTVKRAEKFVEAIDKLSQVIEKPIIEKRRTWRV